MDHRKGKMEEEKFNFTPDNETAGYISQPQSARLDIRSASETPADLRTQNHTHAPGL